MEYFHTPYIEKSKSEKSARLISEELSKLFIDRDIGRISLNDYLYIDKDYDVVAGNHQLGEQGVVLIKRLGC